MKRRLVLGKMLGFGERDGMALQAEGSRLRCPQWVKSRRLASIVLIDMNIV